MQKAVHLLTPANRCCRQNRSIQFSLFMVAVFSVTSAMTSLTSAQDWAGWRGPEQNGMSRSTNLPDDWSLEPSKNVAWMSEVGGRATPSCSMEKSTSTAERMMTSMIRMKK